MIRPVLYLNDFHFNPAPEKVLLVEDDFLWPEVWLRTDVPVDRLRYTDGGQVWNEIRVTAPNHHMEAPQIFTS